MSAGNPNPFSQVEVLQGIGRDLLTQFLARFQADPAACPTLDFRLKTLDSSLPDDAWFCAVASLFSALDFGPKISDPLAEALHSVTELCVPAVASHHQSELSDLGFPVDLPPNASTEHTAVTLWLAIQTLPERLQQQNVTLQPLSQDGPDAVTPAGIPEILHVALERLESISDEPFAEVCIRTGDDLFQSAAQKGLPCPVPDTGQLTCAAFSFSLADRPTECHVQLCPPHTLKLDRAADALIIGAWLFKHKFLIRSLAACFLSLTTPESLVLSETFSETLSATLNL